MKQHFAAAGVGVGLGIVTAFILRRGQYVHYDFDVDVSSYLLQRSTPFLLEYRTIVVTKFPGTKPHAKLRVRNVEDHSLCMDIDLALRCDKWICRIKGANDGKESSHTYTRLPQSWTMDKLVNVCKTTAKGFGKWNLFKNNCFHFRAAVVAALVNA